VETDEKEEISAIERQTNKLLINSKDYQSRATKTAPDEYNLVTCKPARLNWIRTNNVCFEII